MPLKIKNIPAKLMIIPTPRITGNKGCNLLMKAKWTTVGPIKTAGNAHPKYLIPLLSISLFVGILIFIEMIYSFSNASMFCQ